MGRIHIMCMVPSGSFTILLKPPKRARFAGEVVPSWLNTDILKAIIAADDQIYQSWDPKNHWG